MNNLQLNMKIEPRTYNNLPSLVLNGKQLQIKQSRFAPKILTLIACHTNSIAKVNIIKNNIKYFQAFPNNDIVIINSFDSKHHKDVKKYLEKTVPSVQYYGTLNAPTLDCGKWMFYLQNHYKANIYKYVLFTNDSFLIRGKGIEHYYTSILRQNVDLFGYNDSTQIRYHYQSYLFTLKHTVIRRFIMYYNRIKHKLKGYESVVNNVELRLTDIFRSKNCFLKIGSLPSNRGHNIFFNNDQLYLPLYNNNQLPFIKLKRIIQDKQKNDSAMKHKITNE